LNPLTFVAYHGSLRRFPSFVAQPTRRMTVSPTSHFGTFCVADPKIAAHFTLRPHVISEGYQSPQGSRILRDDPWWIDPDPFEVGASVAEVEGILHNPRILTAKAWVELVEMLSAEPHVARAMHQMWQKRGHDGLCIEAWDKTLNARGQTPSVETDATTWVVFDPSALRVKRWFDAVNAWS
jgi:hypothetical protein